MVPPIRVSPVAPPLSTTLAKLNAISRCRSLRRRVNAPTTFAKEHTADAWLNDERRSIEMGTWKDPKQRAIDSETVSEYGRKWLEHHPVRESTRALYRDRLEDHVISVPRQPAVEQPDYFRHPRVAPKSQTGSRSEVS